MADIITRLKLESNSYDSKIKRATQGLLQMEQECRKVGGTLGILEKDQKQFVQSLGSMQTVSTSVRGKIGELSGAFIELRSQYNRLTDEEKKGDFGRTLSGSLEQLKTRVAEAKSELKDIQRELDGSSSVSGGGFLSGLGGKMSGALQVFAGNMLTKATMEVANLGSEMYGMVQQGIELAKAGEGIRNAFERLGRGDILQGLREATHGTVTDIELMKAAVKFNDFKLPLDELGTMLAFAQQKAKDTGQSVDYMVDSIVTGLGRKSLMILDNLGLSATEVREKMKETGDMTKAVGEIIREQMSKAGDYVETAADRAAQANVNLQNKMEELGRKFAPVEEASSQLWTSMKIGILDVIGGPLATLLNQLTEAGRLQNQINSFNGGGNGKQTHTQRVLGMLRHYSGNKQGLYNRQVARYDELEAGEWRNVNRLREELRGLRQKAMTSPGNVQPLIDEATRQMEAAERRAKAWQVMRANYKQGARSILNPQSATPAITDNTVTTPTRTSRHTTTTPKPAKEEKEKELTIQQQIAQLEEEAYKASGERRAEIGAQVQMLDEELARQKAIRDELHGIKKEVSEVQGLSGFNAQTMQAWTSIQQGRLSRAEFGSQEYKNISGNMADVSTLKTVMEQSLRAGIDAAQFDAAGLWEKILGEVDIPDTTWQNIVSVINEKLRSMELEPIEINFKTGSIDKVNTAVATLSKNTQTAGSAMNTLGGAISSLEDPSAKVAGLVMQAIGNVALSFSQAMATPKDPWSWIAFAAAGTATMISTIAAIHSATGYAQGGIVDGRGGGFVGGTSYSGDNIGNVRLDSGELVLNRSQQNNLATALRSDGENSGMRLYAVVKGEDIYLSQMNYRNRTGKGEYVRTRR